MKPCSVMHSMTLYEKNYFDYAKADLRKDAEHTLDSLLHQMVIGLQNIKFRLAAHTDPLHPPNKPTYNKDLAKRRALSVRQFILEHKDLLKVDDERDIEINAVGDEAPIPEILNDCQKKYGVERNPKLIACYQPLRRVEVTVIGEKAPDYKE